MIDIFNWPDLPYYMLSNLKWRFIQDLSLYSSWCLPKHLLHITATWKTKVRINREKKQVCLENLNEIKRKRTERHFDIFIKKSFSIWVKTIALPNVTKGYDIWIQPISLNFILLYWIITTFQLIFRYSEHQNVQKSRVFCFHFWSKVTKKGKWIFSTKRS